MLKNRFFLSLLATMCSIAAWAQQEVRGVVSSNQEPLPGVSIKIAGSNVSTVTDDKGNYAISVPAQNTVLVFSSIGYVSQQVVVGQRRSIDVTLEEDLSALDEVVVVGYGTQKRTNLTGAVSVMSSEDLVKRPVMRASAALQGLAPGVTVTQSSGQPASDGGSIRIRGIGTLGDSNPLVLIDGVAGNLDGIDPNDIESISVLKDAASAAIYGSRSANGVILVTTKFAEKGKMQLNYNGFIGKQQFTELPEFTDTYTYLVKMNEAYENMGRTPLYSESFLSDYLRYKRIDPDNYPDTDWQDELYTGSGITQRHHVSASGGNDRVTVMSSFAYQDQKGIIPNYRSERYSFRLNSSLNIRDNLQSRIYLMGRHSPTIGPSNNVRAAVNRLPGIYPARLMDGSWGVGSNGYNPVAQALEGGLSDTDYDSFRATFQLNYQPIKDLDIEFSFSPDYRSTAGTRFNRSIETYSPGIDDPTYVVPALSTLQRTHLKNWENTTRLLLKYDKSVERHAFNLLAGYERIHNYTDEFGARRAGFPLPDYQYLDAGSTEEQTNSGTAYEWGLQSFFGRLNYAFDDKYLFEANVRADGSSRFPPGKKYGIFPSFSAGWRISEESFLKEANWLSELKLRASWGTLGNQEIGNYPYSSVISLGPSYSFGGARADGGVQRDMVNESISWESTTTSNIGVDFTVLNGKLATSFDYYVRNTTGILLRLPVPAIIGYVNDPYQNAGEVQNKGWDWSVNYRDKVGDFSYNIGFNLSDVKNKVMDLKGAGPIISGFTLIDEGYPINTLFGYQALGLFQTPEQVNDHPVQGFGNYTLGDIMYQDIDGDEEVNASDRVALGNQIPRYTFGLSLGAQYKNIDFSVLLQGVGKRDALFNGDAVWALHNNGKMQTWHLDHWTPENPNASYPRLIAESTHNNYQNSSYWVYSATYMRVKNVQVGYTIPAKASRFFPFNSFRLYAAGDNLFTFHKMPQGWDPERPSGGADIYPIASTFILGLDIKF